MSNDPTVTAGDIARLVDVGRAAVSNWRRRHDDFPRPVGGTASSPLFSLPEVQEWLRRNGKQYELAGTDRVWQRLRTLGDDLGLGTLVAAAGVTLLRGTGERPRPEWPHPLRDASTVRQLNALAADIGRVEAFDFLCARYAEAHARRLSITRPDVAALMTRLVGRADVLFDPACGHGTLLLAGVDHRVAYGQDASDTAAAITEIRLRLRGYDTAVRVGDSLRHDAFTGKLAGAVVCDPPPNDRSWGHEDLVGDARWEFGVPPRGESELAWLQHCLAHTEPGGSAAILLPQMVASRRSGKRIRGALLRAGAVQAVVTLPGGTDLWLLRRPVPTEQPARVVRLVVAAEVSTVERQLADPGHEVAVVDLLDDDVDLSPARHRPHDHTRLAAEYGAAARQLGAGHALALPELSVLRQRRQFPMTTIGELARTGALSIYYAPAPEEGATIPLLTVEDLVANRPPSGVTGGLPQRLAEGDVVAAPTGVARVVGAAEAGAALGQYLTRYRVDPELLDPRFLAGCLRYSEPIGPHGSSRLDVRRTKIPRLTLAEQRDYGRALHGLTAYAEAAAAAAEVARRAARLGFDGLFGGHLGPEPHGGR